MSEEEELEHSFAGNVFCSCASVKTNAWIIDTGAIDHMTPAFDDLLSPVSSKTHAHINLPDGNVAPITYSGFVALANDLKLHNVCSQVQVQAAISF